MAALVVELVEGAVAAIEALGEAVEVAEEAAEAAEIAAEVTEASEALGSLSGVVNTFTGFMETVCTYLPKIVGVAAVVATIGAIVWKKVITVKHEKKAKEAWMAVGGVYKTVSSLLGAAVDWMKKHEDDTVEMGGIKIAVNALIGESMKPLTKHFDTASSVAKKLKEQTDKKQENVSEKDDIHALLSPCEKCLTDFKNLLEFISQHEETYPVLKSFPLKQEDIDNLAPIISAAQKAYDAL